MSYLRCYMDDPSDGTILRYSASRMSKNQFGLMVDFMTQNPELVQTRITPYFTKEQWTQKWEELTALLNADFTGGKKEAEKWRKCWNDQKCLIKTKAAKLEAIKRARGPENFSYKLNDLEEKVLTLIGYRRPYARKSVNSSMKISEENEAAVKKINVQPTPNIHKINEANEDYMRKINIQPTSKIQNYAPQETKETNVILIDLNSQTVPLKLDSIDNSLKLYSVNIPPAQIEGGNRTELKSSNDTSLISASSNDFNLFQSKNASLILDTYDPNSKLNVQNAKKVDEKNSSLLTAEFLPNVLIPRITDVRSTSQEIEKPTTPEIIESTISSPPKKKFKIADRQYFQKKNDFRIIKLLERQNNILEGIAGTLTRIERSLDYKSSLELQRKDSMIINISQNIQMLSDSLGSVSKSLKSIIEN